MDFWVDRLKQYAVDYLSPVKRFGDEEQVITVYDPDGLELELVAHRSAEKVSNHVWKEGSVPTEHAIRGFYSVTLSEEGYERTASVLAKELGFHFTREEGSRFRYETVSGSSKGLGSIVDVLCLPYTPYGFIGVGTVHHVAWRTPTDEQQKVLRHKIIKAGLNATPVIDRTYFHSVYFREPGGVLFEIATNPPGFAIDEKPEELGTHLKLPSWLEHDRKDLEKLLPKVKLLSSTTKKEITEKQKEK
jgi:glyoxalase family protein